MLFMCLSLIQIYDSLLILGHSSVNPGLRLFSSPGRTRDHDRGFVCVLLSVQEVQRMFSVKLYFSVHEQNTMSRS